MHRIRSARPPPSSKHTMENRSSRAEYFFPSPERTRDLDGIGDAYTLGVSTDFIINGLLCLHLSAADIKSGSRSGVRCDPSRFNLISIPRCIWMFQDQGVVRNGTRKKLKRTRYAQRHFIVVVCHAHAQRISIVAPILNTMAGKRGTDLQGSSRCRMKQCIFRG